LTKSKLAFIFGAGYKFIPTIECSFKEGKMKNNVGLETDLKSNHSGISFDLGIKTSIAILTGIVLLRIVIHFLLY
jgi:hypothetical protein